ncbi:hypothetical protein H7J86_32240 [Mycobacterium hackensackense]|uniref:hypothetical protein n=1 Tax=Mycobacterium hackensackense TaxID=228909 RepID=UPI002265F396|nr:hypothetical protein [Mycobacterium hackensackense]MCV7256856.1 hypothetical protein [Mycobacterium hackensackense]
MSVSKGGGCADEVIGSNWPTENEDSYTAYATALLEKASQAQKAAQAKQAEQQYAQSETSSQTLDALAKAAGMDAAKHMQSAEDFAKAAGWAKYAATAIKAAKLAMNEAAAAHQAIHDMPTISAPAAAKGGKGATQQVKDTDLEEKQSLVADAKGSMDSALDAADRAVQADAIPTPFGGTPAIPDDAGAARTQNESAGAGLPGDAPVASVPGGGAGAPSASAGGGGGASAAPAAPALPPSVFAAPAAPPTGLGGDPASALGSSPAASAGEGAAGAGSGMGSGMGGMPMGGSPMGGMPMQPPQMPQGGGAGAGGGPVGEVAKPVSDMVSKLAGKDGGAGAGGVPVSEQTLDKLLAAQGGEGGAGGDQLAPSDDGSGDGKGGDGKGDHLGGDPKKDAGSHDQVTGVRAPTDPYSASNTNPALNNPAASHGGAPSPAAPVVTAPPVAVSAPMTELSADDNVPAATVQHASAQVQPPTVENAGLHTHTAAAGITGPGAPAPASPTPNPQAQGGLLGAYPAPGGMPGPTPPMGGMPMMPPMGGMGAGGGGGGGSVSPVLAAVPAAIGGAVVARDAHREPAGDAPVERILALPPEHATAENHLAGLAKVFRTRGWESERIAVGVFMDGTVLQPRLRYIVATSDGLSLIPLGIATPAGVELLSQQRVRSSFVSDWSGNDHPGRKLAALASEYSEQVGRLVYLVSTDSDAVQSPGRSGDVAEVYQTAAETTGLIRDNRATSAVAPRTEIVRGLPIREEQAQEALAAFGAAWGFHDATADDLNSARAMLWAARWGRARSRSDDYPALLATYLYVEGLEALRAGRLDEAAYSAASMLSVEPLDA